MAKVTLYTMEYCPYCKQAKGLLTRRGIAFEEILVPDDDNAQWDALYKRSGMRTMPQIFDGDRLVGGYQELVELDGQDQLASLK
jgi:glutaredoxin 3